MAATEVLVNIDVDDLKKAERFYCDAFGLVPGRRFGGNGVELLGTATTIWLLVQPAGSQAAATIAQPRDYRRHWTPVHLDFVVPDIQAAVAQAEAAGAVCEKAITQHAWGKLALMADPFGHGFCLLTFEGRGYDEVADPPAG